MPAPNCNKLHRLLNLMPCWLPSLYLAGGVFVLLQFWQQPPDGLANILIVLYTLPLALLGNWLWPGQFPFMPGNFHLAHTLYFIPAVVLLAGGLWLILKGLRDWIAQFRSGRDADRIL